MNITCHICMDSCRGYQVMSFTVCGHIFHKYCISKWLISSQTCPQCRQEISPDDVFDINWFSTEKGKSFGEEYVCGVYREMYREVLAQIEGWEKEIEQYTSELCSMMKSTREVQRNYEQTMGEAASNFLEEMNEVSAIEFDEKQLIASYSNVINEYQETYDELLEDNSTLVQIKEENERLEERVQYLKNLIQNERNGRENTLQLGHGPDGLSGASNLVHEQEVEAHRNNIDGMDVFKGKATK